MLMKLSEPPKRQTPAMVQSEGERKQISEESSFRWSVQSLGESSIVAFQQPTSQVSDSSKDSAVMVALRGIVQA